MCSSQFRYGIRFFPVRPSFNWKRIESRFYSALRSHLSSIIFWVKRIVWQDTVCTGNCWHKSLDLLWLRDARVSCHLKLFSAFRQNTDDFAGFAGFSKIGGHSIIIKEKKNQIQTKITRQNVKKNRVSKLELEENKTRRGGKNWQRNHIFYEIIWNWIGLRKQKTENFNWLDLNGTKHDMEKKQ